MRSDALVLDLTPKGRAIIDADFPGMSGQSLTWRLDTRTPYRPRAYSYLRVRGKYTKVYLERLVMKAPQGQFVRFHNGVTLDCRKANLEVVKWRSEVTLADQQRRIEWKVEEAGGLKTSPQRRRTEVWRMWCEGQEPGQIAKLMHSSLRTIKQDIVAMAENPFATQSEIERDTPKR